MDAPRKKHTPISDVHVPAHKQASVHRAVVSEPRFIITPAHRPQQYASDIISPAKRVSDSSYARFYRKAVTAAERTINGPAILEHTLAHQAVLQARPVATPSKREHSAPSKKKAKKRGRKAAKRTANVLIVAALMMSGVMGFMVYRYHLALQKVEALPLQAVAEVESVVPQDNAVAPAAAAISEAKPKATGTYSGKLAPGTPYTVSIPKLKVSASVISVGLTKAGAMNVPGNIWQIGWDKTSAKPADNTGVVIMNGHVHGPTQPGVFANLTKLKAGDLITVKDVGGTSYTYKVDSTQTFKAGEAEGSLQQSASPTKQGLNLVTCTGQIKDSEYQSRFVVYAERV